MATASQRSGIRGINKLRRTLRRIEPELQEPIRQAIKNTAESIKLDAVAGAPIDEGDLVRSIDYKIGRDGFTAVIGPGARAAEIARRRAGSPFATRIASGEIRLSAVNKKDLFQFFKAYWIEFGTKGSPEHNVPPLPARPFMGPAYLLNEEYGKAQVRAAVKQALERASRGG